jgi:TRAP-type mannitol/chloroaromatic compound transport system permease small subunit
VVIAIIGIEAMRILARLELLERAINGFSEMTGRAVSWLFVAMVVVQVAVVIFRYVFGIGDPLANDAVHYMHVITFMTLAGYALRHDAHVRVDIFYLNSADRVKGMIDLGGVVLALWPMCAVMAWSAWPYVANSWAIREGSARVSGIQGTFFLKTFILVFAAVLALQGVAMAISGLTRIARPHAPSVRI